MPPLPCLLRLQICRRGLAVDTQAVEVAAAQLQGVAGWDQLLPLLAQAEGVPAIGRLWTLFGDDDAHEELLHTRGRIAWQSILGLLHDGTLIVEATGELGDSPHARRIMTVAGEGEALPAET